MGNAVYGNASFGAATVSTAATAIGVPLGNRINIVIWNNDASVTLFLGFGLTSSTVTTATGFPVLPQTFISLDFGPQITIHGIAASSINVRFSEAY